MLQLQHHNQHLLTAASQLFLLLYLTRPRMTHFGDSGKRQILVAFRLSVTYFRAIHSVVPHSVVSLRRMKWTTEWGQPNGQNSRKHFPTKTGCSTARSWHWLVKPRAQRAAIVLFEISYLRFEI